MTPLDPPVGSGLSGESLAKIQAAKSKNDRLPAWARENLKFKPKVSRDIPARERLPWISTAYGLTQPGVELYVEAVRRRQDLIDLILTDGQIIVVTANELGKAQKMADKLRLTGAKVPPYTDAAMAEIAQQVVFSIEQVQLEKVESQAAEWGYHYLSNATKLNYDPAQRPASHHWPVFEELKARGENLRRNDEKTYGALYATAQRSAVLDMPDGGRLLVMGWFEQHVRTDCGESRIGRKQIRAEMELVEWRPWKNSRGAVTIHHPERTDSITMYFWHVPRGWEQKWVEADSEEG